jgi:hypothetical protein
MGLCMSVYVLFICKVSLLRLYMWKRSNVSIIGPFFSNCNMPIVSSMVPYVCCEYLELGLLFRIACMCFLYLVLKFLPVSPIYFSGCSLHFIHYIPLLLCLVLWVEGVFVQFSVLYAIRIFVLLSNLVIILVSFTIYVYLAHFCFCVVLDVVIFSFGFCI